MRKGCEHPNEIYMTKLMNLFYQGEENLYKVRSPKVDGKEIQEILVKFIPNVEKYGDFERMITNLDDEKFNEIREKIDEKSVLRLLIANFLIQNIDINTGNILIKNQGEKIKLIPIDFAHFMTNEDFSHLKNFNDDISDFKKNIKEKNFFEAKKILIEKYALKIESFKNKTFRNGSIIQSEIDLEYQLSRISDQEFKEILTEMFAEYKDMKKMLEEYKIKEPREIDKIVDLEKRVDDMKNAIDSLQEKNQAPQTNLILEDMQEILDLSKISNKQKSEDDLAQSL
jgi:hypothetical protein